VKRQNRDSAAGLEAERNISEECFQRSELVIYRNPQRLKNAAYGVVIATGLSHGCRQLHGRRGGRVE